MKVRYFEKEIEEELEYYSCVRYDGSLSIAVLITEIFFDRGFNVLIVKDSDNDVRFTVHGLATAGPGDIEEGSWIVKKVSVSSESMVMSEDTFQEFSGHKVKEKK